mgnify:CR=1 FL=1
MTLNDLKVGDLVTAVCHRVGKSDMVLRGRVCRATKQFIDVLNPLDHSMRFLRSTGEQSPKAHFLSDPQWRLES